MSVQMAVVEIIMTCFWCLLTEYPEDGRNLKIKTKHEF